MKWLKNFDRLLEIQRNIVWPSVLELDPKQVCPQQEARPFYQLAKEIFGMVHLFPLAPLTIRASVILATWQTVGRNVQVMVWQ